MDRGLLVIGLSLLLIEMSAADRSGDASAWFVPFIKPSIASADAGAVSEPTADLSAGGGTYERSTWRVGAGAQPWHDTNNEFRLKGFFAQSDVHTDGVLPLTGTIPDRLYDVSGSALFRHVEADGRIVGGEVQIRSASDHPFASMRETGVNITAFARLPAGGQDGWLFFLNYANDRAFLNNVGIPGVAYQWLPDRTLMVMAGLPIMFVMWNPTPQVRMHALGSFFGSAHADVSLQPIRTVSWAHIELAYDWDAITFKRDGRPDTQDQLSYRFMRTTLGLALTPMADAKIEIYGGYVFHREVYETDSQWHASRNRFWIEPGAVFGASVAAGF